MTVLFFAFFWVFFLHGPPETASHNCTLPTAVPPIINLLTNDVQWCYACDTNRVGYEWEDLLLLVGGMPLFSPFFFLFFFALLAQWGKKRKKCHVSFYDSSCAAPLFSGESFASSFPQSSAAKFFSFLSPNLDACIKFSGGVPKRSTSARINRRPVGWSLGEVLIYSKVTYRKGHLRVQLSIHGLKPGRMAGVGQG